MAGFKREPAFPQGDDDVLIVTDLDTLKLIADPLRLRMLELLRGEPRTVKELARSLGVAPTKLYYHVNLLTEHGLVRVTGTQLVSGITEKRYQVAAARLSIDRSLLTPADAGDEGLEAWLSVVLDEAKSEIRKSAQSGLIDATEKEPERRGLVLGRNWYRLTPRQAQAFNDLLRALEGQLATLATEDGPESDAGEPHTYELLVGFYPTVAPPNAAPDRHSTG